MKPWEVEVCSSESGLDSGGAVHGIVHSILGQFAEAVQHLREQFRSGDN